MPENAACHFTYTQEQCVIHKHSRTHKQSHFQGHTERCCCVYLLRPDSKAPGTNLLAVCIVSFKLQNKTCWAVELVMPIKV